MSSNRRNILVGATVLGGLIILGWMLLKFGATPAKIFSEDTFPIQLVSDRADGISEGAQIYYRGVSVGRVVSVERATNQREVLIGGAIDMAPPLPENLMGSIRYAGLLGGNSQLNLELTDKDPRGQLTRGATLKARFIGLDFLPKEFAELATDLRETSKQFRDSKLLDHLNAAVITAQQTMQGLKDVVTDEKTRNNVKQSIENIRAASESASRIAVNIDKFSQSLEGISADTSATIKKAQSSLDKTQGHIDNLATNMTDRLGQISKLLDSFQSISTKLDQGKGTAGQLVNDPKLYESLVDTSKELRGAIQDIRRVVEQWEQEGVSFRVK